MKFDRSLFIGKFSAEAQEHLQKLNEGILRLERGDADPSTSSGQDLMADILRAAHTLKGSARMMGFKDINQVAHKLEDLLLELKEGRLQASHALCDLLFQALDTMDACRQAIVEGREDEIQVDKIAGLLERTAQGEPLPEARPPAAPSPTTAQPVEDTPPGAHPSAPEPIVEEQAPSAAPEAVEDKLEPGLGAAPAIVPAQLRAEPPKPVPPPPARKALPLAEEQIRVSATKLDKTIRLTGEVIAAQKRAEMRQADLRRAWQMAKDHWRELRVLLGEQDPEAVRVLESAQALRDHLDGLFKQNREDVASLSQVVMELQEDALGLRMLPVSTVFDTFPRAIRDLARERGKEIDLVVEGSDTELDKQMLERINDPLMHMLRNAVDHGVELPDERATQGKARRGTIWLRAYPMGGSIVIEVKDDGRGLSLDAIRARALNKGLLSEDTLHTMSDRELRNLIFLSGFTTSQQVTDISGRGVGLDVVRRNVIEELKGDISVETEEGKGTRFILTLPLTLTTQRILFVSVKGQVFGLPVTYVSETTRVLPHQVIQVVDRQAIRLRDQIVPIARLADVLSLPEAGSPAAEQRTSGQWLYLVIAQAADERVALVVNDVANEDDVLIKPLPRHMKRIGILSGATIAPDGTIIPILHVPGLIRAVRGTPTARLAAEEAEAEQAPRLLVVDDSLNTREIEKSILEACGYQVDLAKDGMDALRVIDQAPGTGDGPYYDLLVVDIEMPRLDGLSLTERLRRDERYAHVPIVIVSSRDKPEDRRRGLDVGADAYIVKGSFDQQDLIATVASLLGRPAP
jgi:two-component system chemotaxis sensor kinase CheA